MEVTGTDPPKCPNCRKIFCRNLRKNGQILIPCGGKGVANLNKKIFLLIIVLLLFTQRTLAASYVVLDEPVFRDAVVTLGEIYYHDEPSLIVAEENTIFYLDGEDRKTLIKDLSGKVTAIAVGDVSGNGKNDLVIATTSGGALYSFSENRGVWEANGQPVYLWDNVRTLEVKDINNDGYDDAVVLTENGELQILIGWEGRLLPFWKSSEDQRISNFQILDINGDKLQEIIYTVDSGYISILAWNDQELSTLWQNYPWGSIDSLVAIPNGSNPEWLVVTSQKMLYGWRMQNGRIVSSKQFQASELGERLFYIPGHGLLSLSQKTGASLFDLKNSSVVEKWNVPGVFGNKAFYHEKGFYVLDENLDCQRLVVASGEWRLFMYDEEITSSVGVLDSEEQLYFKLSDLARMWGLNFFGGYDWYYWMNDREILIKASSRQIVINGFAIPLVDPVMERDNSLYVSSELLAYFGWNAEVNSSRQRVVFVKNWGWWL